MTKNEEPIAVATIQLHQKVGRPKKVKSDAKFDKKTYMRNYMKTYQARNPAEQQARRNTHYYIKKFNISQDFVDKYGVWTGHIYKTIEDINKINEECPSFIENIKEYLENINKNEKKNHIADLSGIEVLTEIE